MTPQIIIRSYTTDQYYLDKIFYSNFYRIKKANSEKRSVIVDVGAHCGYFTLAAIAAGYQKCYAFEPHSENFRILNKNTEVFVDIVSCYQLGIYHSDTFMNLVAPKMTETEFIDFGKIEPKDGGGESSFAISLNKLHPLIKEKSIDILKINVGYAFDFITGNSEALEFVNNICLEMPYSPEEITYLSNKLLILGFKDSLIVELKENDKNFGFLAFFSKNSLDERFEITDLRERNFKL